jgi:hypothetical protein
VKALWALAVVLGAMGCQFFRDRPACDGQHILVAVAPDATPGGPTYLVDRLSPDDGTRFTVERAGDLSSIVRSTSDGTAIALLAPASGGVVVVNGGAAARRFDASGKALWTIGYGATVGVAADLVGGEELDDLVVADAASVRRYAADGTLRWERALPTPTRTVSQVVGDRAGGAWVVGTFMGGPFPPWITTQPAPIGELPKHFILRFDAAGNVVSGHAWDSFQDGDVTLRQVLVAVDATGASVLVVAGVTDLQGLAAPAFGITTRGSQTFAAGLDAAGGLLWSRAVDAGAALAVDAAGTVLALSPSTSPSSLAIARWGDDGTDVAQATVSVGSDTTGSLSWVTAPVADGVVVAGQHLETDTSESATCAHENFLMRVDTATLQSTPLPLKVP